MAKVLHIVLNDYHDDYSYQENLLSQKHKEQGHDVYIVTSQKYKDSNWEIHYRAIGSYVNRYGIKVYVLPYNCRHNWQLVFLNRTKGLYSCIKEIKPDIIFYHNFIERDVRSVVRYAKEHSSVEVYVDSHNDYINTPVKGFLGWAKMLSIRRNARVIASVAKCFWGTLPIRCEYMNRVYGIPRDKIKLLIMGADEKLIETHRLLKPRLAVRGKYGIPDNAILICTGGKLEKRKKIDLLIKAVADYGDKNVWLIVFGKPSKDMEQIYSNLKTNDRVIFVGWVDSEYVCDIFLASDLGFFPGTHSVLWEQAVACELPCVFHRMSGITHVDVGGNAIFIEDVSVDTIKQTLKHVFMDGTLDKMKKRAKVVASQFYLDNIAKISIGKR